MIATFYKKTTSLPMLTTLKIILLADVKQYGNGFMICLLDKLMGHQAKKCMPARQPFLWGAGW